MNLNFDREQERKAENEDYSKSRKLTADEWDNARYFNHHVFYWFGAFWSLSKKNNRYHFSRLNWTTSFDFVWSFSERMGNKIEPDCLKKKGGRYQNFYLGCEGH